MRHQRALLAICGIFLIVAACAPASPPKGTPSPSSSSAGSVAPSTGTSPTPIAISPAAILAVDTMLATMSSQSVFSGSVLISQHGHVLLSKGYGFADRAKKTPNSPLTRFLIGWLHPAGLHHRAGIGSELRSIPAEVHSYASESERHRLQPQLERRGDWVLR